MTDPHPGYPLRSSPWINAAAEAGQAGRLRRRHGRSHRASSRPSRTRRADSASTRRTPIERLSRCPLRPRGARRRVHGPAPSKRAYQAVRPYACSGHLSDTPIRARPEQTQVGCISRCGDARGKAWLATMSSPRVSTARRLLVTSSGRGAELLTRAHVRESRDNRYWLVIHIARWALATASSRNCRETVTTDPHGWASYYRCVCRECPGDGEGTQ
jgi:hypothetical protein